MDSEEERKIAEYDARRRRIEKIVIVALTLVLFALLALEASLFNFRGSFPVPYNLLFFALLNVNIILIFLLLFLVFRNIAKLVFERRAGILGSKLRTKLIVAFTSFALIPTIVFFYVAVTFITNSIDRWFSIQVEASLTESLEVAQNYYKVFEESAVFFSERISDGLAQQVVKEDIALGFPNPVFEAFIRERQEEYNLDAVDVYNIPDPRARFMAGEKLPSKELTESQLEMLDAGWGGKSASRTFDRGEGETVWGMAPVQIDDRIVGVLVVRYQIPQSLLERMRSIVTAYEQYNQLQILEGPLKASYVIILGLIALFIFFGATWFGFTLARNMVGPIQNLAEGTKKVAQGDLNVRLKATTQDEFAVLVENFNIMTERLAQGRLALEHAAADLRKVNVESERRRVYMETVLGNITAGVISFDEKDRISTINTSAKSILGLHQSIPPGKAPEDVFGRQFDDVRAKIMSALRRNPKRTELRQVEVEVVGRSKTLLVSVTQIHDDKDVRTGTVLVLEDLTNLVKAQRMAAWQEVAQKIAHEIKNPLTPIQLAAQRLRKRYGTRFADDEKVFGESTSMIIQQVDELKKLVNEFSNFARMANPRPNFHDLNDMLGEAVILYSEAHKNIRFNFDKDGDLPTLYCDRDQVKRVFINVIDNAVASISGKGGIHVVSRLVEESKMAQIVIEDSGVGLPAKYKDRLFEPYFSTKKMGTGLGLAIVNQIVNDMGGSIWLEDNEPRGTRVTIKFPFRNTPGSNKAVDQA